MVSSNNQMWSFQRTQTPIKIWAILLLLLLISNSSFTVESKCKKGCPLALASYYVWDEANITFISQIMDSTANNVLSYNPAVHLVPDKDRIEVMDSTGNDLLIYDPIVPDIEFSRINVPFSCDCINGSFLGQIFTYRVIKGDTYDTIAKIYYSNLTTVSWIQQHNSFDPSNLPLNAIVNVPVNCSCGSSAISKDYGLFLTYPLRPEENLTYIDQLTNSTPSLLQIYNPNVNIGSGSGILFIPAKDKTGKYPPLTSSSEGCYQEDGHEVVKRISCGVEGLDSCSSLKPGTEPLPWLSRVQIALDSARGLEYIHEHTVPVYIHRDIKPANILIDKNFHAKVADFGLAKLVGKFSEPTRLIGTFGYMAPEYGHYGEITPKADVYAFGVVLYELISAKTAIVRDDDKFGEAKPLSRLFEAVLDQHDPNEFRRLVDVRLGNDYPLDSVYKMARLAKACTQENPELRPTMRFVVVALTTMSTMSSTSGDWNVGSFFEDSTSPKNSTFDLI